MEDNENDNKKKTWWRHRKDVFGLYSGILYLETVLGMPTEMLEGLFKLFQNIFFVHSDWYAHNILHLRLNHGSVIATDDLQMGITLEYAENPTSKSYSTNNVVFALYPIYIEYVYDNGQLKKRSLAFLSEDCQQLGESIFSVIQEKVQTEIDCTDVYAG